jgi:hypothetical protein
MLRKKQMTQRIKEWYQNHGRITKPAGATSSKKIIDYLRGTAPKMPEWRLYGSMYYEDKLKPQVDRLYEAACLEYEKRCAEGTNTDDSKPPKRVTIWSAVAKEEYGRESDDVKKKVAAAVEAAAAEDRKVGSLEE